MVDPAAAKLHPFWKLGEPTESRYAFRNGKSIASTAKNYPKSKILNQTTEKSSKQPLKYLIKNRGNRGFSWEEAEQ